MTEIDQDAHKLNISFLLTDSILYLFQKNLWYKENDL